MQFPDARILIFSRVPRVGRVKTRLIPLLGEKGACAFHLACLEHALARFCADALAPVELWLDTEPGGSMLEERLLRYPCSVQVQCQGDLGVRMRHAADASPGGGPVILLGTDAPLLPVARVRQTFEQLQGHDVVLGPAEDGGYVLLGLREMHAELFEEMPWGSERVAEQTREVCDRLGLRRFELPLSWDIDRPEDVQRLLRTRDPGLEPLRSVAAQHLPRL